MLRLSEEQVRTVMHELKTQTKQQVHTQVWARRSYAPMHIHKPEFADVKRTIEAALPDYAVVFDVVFESAGPEVAWHVDYESLGPFVVPSRWKAIRESHFKTVHFNLTPNGGALVANSSLILAYIFYLAIAMSGIFGWMHRALLATLPLGGRVSSNEPRVGNVFDNVRMHMVTAGDPRTSYVVRLVKRNGCVFISRDSILAGLRRSAACAAFHHLLPHVDRENRDATEVNWQCSLTQMTAGDE